MDFPLTLKLKLNIFNDHQGFSLVNSHYFVYLRFKTFITAITETELKLFPFGGNVCTKKKIRGSFITLGH